MGPVVAAMPTTDQDRDGLLTLLAAADMAEAAERALTGDQPAEGDQNDQTMPLAALPGLTAAHAARARRARGRYRSPAKLLPGGPCTCCSAKLSPQWRRPVIHDHVLVLCNACGIYFARHKALPSRAGKGLWSLGPVQQDTPSAGTGDDSGKDTSQEVRDVVTMAVAPVPAPAMPAVAPVGSPDTSAAATALGKVASVGRHHTVVTTGAMVPLPTRPRRASASHLPSPSLSENSSFTPHAGAGGRKRKGAPLAAPARPPPAKPARSATEHAGTDNGLAGALLARTSHDSMVTRGAPLVADFTPPTPAEAPSSGKPGPGVAVPAPHRALPQQAQLPQPQMFRPGTSVFGILGSSAGNGGKAPIPGPKPSAGGGGDATGVGHHFVHMAPGGGAYSVQQQPPQQQPAAYTIVYTQNGGTMQPYTVLQHAQPQPQPQYYYVAGHGGQGLQNITMVMGPQGQAYMMAGPAGPRVTMQAVPGGASPMVWGLPQQPQQHQQQLPPQQVPVPRPAAMNGGGAGAPMLRMLPGGGMGMVHPMMAAPQVSQMQPQQPGGAAFLPPYMVASMQPRMA